MTSATLARWALAVSALALTACSSQSPSQLEASNIEELKGYVQQAKDASVADIQIQLLERALAGEVLTYEDMVGLNDAVVQCLTDAGVDAFVLPSAESVPGVLLPQFGARGGPGQTDDEAHTLMNACYAKYMGYAQEFYFRQPSSLQAQSDDFHAVRASVIDCLALHSVIVDLEASDDEVYRAVQDDIDQHSQQPDFEPCYRGATNRAP